MDPSIDWKSLYIQWLTDAFEAANKRKNAMYKAQALQKSLNSLQTCSLATIQDPKQLKSLKFVGEKTVQMLVKKSIDYCTKESLPIPDCLRAVSPAPAAGAGGGADGGGASIAGGAGTGKNESKRKYLPRYGSTAYHILLGLRSFELEDLAGQGMGRKDILRYIKPRLMLSTESQSTKQLPNLATSLNVLSGKKLICCTNSHYFLEEEGRVAADSLLRVEREQHGPTGTTPARPAPAVSLFSPVSTRNSFKVITWQPGEFEVKMLLDNREVASRENRSGFSDALAERGVPLEVCALSVGDVLWIAEHKSSGRRAVLDFIVERKSLRDLVQSIMDGRFFEQKTRLAKSSLGNVIYLIEMMVLPDLARHGQRIQTAMSQLLTMRDFHLKQTSSQNDTVLYLSQMTSEITTLYSKKPLQLVVPHIDSFGPSMAEARTKLGRRHLGIDYVAFDEGLSKSRSLSVAQVFVTMLMTIKGISAERAHTIQRLYPTPTHLWRAYAQRAPSDRAAMLFQHTRANILRRQIPLDASQMVYKVWAPLSPAVASSL